MSAGPPGPSANGASAGGGNISSSQATGGTGVGSSQQQNLNNIVLEYLSKKGYARTEYVLRQESSNTDENGRPIVNRTEDLGADRYHKALSLTKNWIDGNLDVYKPELRRILWPLFVHGYLDLVADFQPEKCEEFFNAHKDLFIPERDEELKLIFAIKLPEHIAPSEFAQMYRTKKYRVTLTNIAFSTLVQFLEAKEKEGGSIILALITTHLQVLTRASSAVEPGTFAALMNPHRDDDLPGEEEGIAGDPRQGSSLGTNGPLAKLRLGRLPMETDLLEDVRAELLEEDQKNPPVIGQNTLAAEFEGMIKKEDDLEPPTADELPMPPSTARDVAMEVQKVKENRDRFVIENKSGGAGPGVSVAMYTFHNTYGTANVTAISPDNYLIAIGTSNSYIRVWSTDGSILTSTAPDHVGYKPSNSRRLIGHSGPVFALSFNPGADNREVANPPETPSARSRFLLSSSADGTVRLWFLDSWVNIVIYSHHQNPVWDVTWGPFGHYFLSGSMDKTACLWTTNHASVHRLFVGHDKDVDCVAFHPNSAYCFTASSDFTIRMWSCSSGETVRIFVGHTHNITSLSASRDGKMIASADDGGFIFLWDLASGRRIKRMRGHGKGGIWSMDWSMESKVLVSGGQDGTVRVWDIDPSVSDQSVQGKVVGDTDIISNKVIDAAGAQGASQSGAAAAGGPSGKKKKGKEVVITPDQISAFATKRTPVHLVKFTRGNLILAAGPNMAPV